MKMSNEIGKIAPAIVAIAANMTVIKDTEGGHSAKYDNLSNKLAVIRHALQAADPTGPTDRLGDGDLAQLDVTVLLEEPDGPRSMLLDLAGQCLLQRGHIRSPVANARPARPQLRRADPV